MDGIEGLLARDFGVRPQGKAAPIAGASRSTGSAAGAAAAACSAPRRPGRTTACSASAPAFDDDLLGGFGSLPRAEPVAVDDDDVLLGPFGRSPSEEKRKPVAAREDRMGSAGFDDLIPGFAGSSSPPRSRQSNDDNKMKPPIPTFKQTASMADDHFFVLETASGSGSSYTAPGRSTDPVEDLDKSARFDGKAANNIVDDDSLFEESSAFDEAPKSDPLFTSELNGHAKDTNPPSVARDSSLHHSLDRL